MLLSLLHASPLRLGVSEMSWESYCDPPTGFSCMELEGEDHASWAFDRLSLVLPLVCQAVVALRVGFAGFFLRFLAVRRVLVVGFLLLWWLSSFPMGVCGCVAFLLAAAASPLDF
ncbi:unnamed protein product [Linum trigynum]|uniref:Transmembrane protein n=1 Tax=Linum trigynum TaxID=586398 RepID=A0AAV2F2G3_9ROSI